MVPQCSAADALRVQAPAVPSWCINAALHSTAGAAHEPELPLGSAMRAMQAAATTGKTGAAAGATSSIFDTSHAMIFQPGARSALSEPPEVTAWKHITALQDPTVVVHNLLGTWYLLSAVLLLEFRHSVGKQAKRIP